MKKFMFKSKVLLLYLLGAEINVATYEGGNLLGGTTLQVSSKGDPYKKGISYFISHKKWEIKNILSITDFVIEYGDEITEEVIIYFLSHLRWRLRKLGLFTKVLSKLILGKTIWFNPIFPKASSPERYSGGRCNLYQGKNIHLVVDCLKGRVFPGGRR